MGKSMVPKYILRMVKQRHRSACTYVQADQCLLYFLFERYNKYFLHTIVFVQASPASLLCVLEQDTLILA